MDQWIHQCTCCAMWGPDFKSPGFKADMDAGAYHLSTGEQRQAELAGQKT